MKRNLTVYVSTIRSSVFLRSYSAKVTGTGNGENVIEQKNDEKAKRPEPKDRIINILNTMIEENAQRGCQKFQSKFPNENKSFRKSQLLIRDDFKSDDSDESKIKKVTKVIAQNAGNNKTQVENDLLEKVMEIYKPVDINWGELILGMKVEKDDQNVPSRADQVKKLMKFTSNNRTQLDSTVPRVAVRSKQIEKVNLQDSTDLSIFNDIKNHTYGTELNMWNTLKENELRISITHPPSNYYEKMIMWTNQGKIWKFPIDNEQGMDAEQSIHFSEHVFLEPHLEGWCPTKGPIRSFMELVCVGLSKNPYFTVQEKIDHIMWYKNYFESNIELLQQTGVLQDGFADKVKQLQK